MLVIRCVLVSRTSTDCPASTSVFPESGTSTLAHIQAVCPTLRQHGRRWRPCCTRSVHVPEIRAVSPLPNHLLTFGLAGNDEWSSFGVSESAENADKTLKTVLWMQKMIILGGSLSIKRGTERPPVLNLCGIPKPERRKWLTSESKRPRLFHGAF